MLADELPEIIHNVKDTQFSIARHYGGIKINGHMYIYNPKDDTLIKSLALCLQSYTMMSFGTNTSMMQSKK